MVAFSPARLDPKGNHMKYKVVGGAAQVGADIPLYLSKEQAAARESQIEKRGNFFHALSVIQFKAGEEINIACAEGKIPGSLMSRLEPLGDKRKARSKPKTKVD